jgi:hypothetical protein
MATIRYEKEVSGLVINIGSEEASDYVWCPTDRTSQTLINGSYILAKTNPDYHIDSWKYGDLSTGQATWRSLTNDQILIMGTAVSRLVEQAFSTERALTLQRSRATSTSEVRAIVWPN